MKTIRKIKGIAINVSLVCISLVLIYLFFELIFFRYFLTWLPVKTHWFLNDPIRVLAQSSKKRTIPKNYIAIIGDSHAQGLGDWILEINPLSNSDHYSGDILNNKTNRDVVNMALQSSGIIRGIVINPIYFYEYINSTYLFRLEPPKQIIVYFYEGNDLNDTIRRLKNTFNEKYDIGHIYDRVNFRKYLDDETHYARNLVLSLKDNLHFINFLNTLIKNFKKDYAGLWDWDNFNKNEVLLSGGVVKIPDILQSPALELTEEELKMVIYVLEQSLLYLRNYFKNVPISVVYLPSILSTYEIASSEVSIETYHGRKQIYPRERVQERSDQIYQMVAEILDKHDFKYVDARPKLREAAKNKLIHGPIDWWHLNKAGQHVLAEVVMDLIEK